MFVGSAKCKWKLDLRMDSSIQESPITETWGFQFVYVLSSFCVHWNAPIAMLKVEVLGHWSNWLVHFPMCEWSVLLILVTVLCYGPVHWLFKLKLGARRCKEPVLNKIAHQIVHVMNSNQKKPASSSYFPRVKQILAPFGPPVWTVYLTNFSFRNHFP